MSQQCSHRIYLRMTRGCIRAVFMDFFKNDGGGGQIKASATIGLGDQTSQISCPGQGRDKGIRISTISIQRTPIAAGKFSAYLGNRRAYLGVVFRIQRSRHISILCGRHWALFLCHVIRPPWIVSDIAYFLASTHLVRCNGLSKDMIQGISLAPQAANP